MALRNQPYIPLYVNDFTTDEKLIECSAESTGVYIRIMCLMHKSEQYGKILLKQKSKQSDNQIKNFALQIAKCFPYDSEIILRSLTELVDESVLQIEGDFLIQKRMVKDNNISETRAEAGKKGGKTTQNRSKKDTNFAKANNKAKHKANTEYEYVNENVIKNVIIIEKNELETAFENFKEMRKASRKPLTKRAEEMIKTRLKELSGNDMDLAVKILNQSTMNNWASIYELKKEYNGKTVQETQENKIKNAAFSAIQNILNK